MTTLHRLFDEGGQSPWIDNISRHSVRQGDLAHLVEQGIRGVTSNPTIFQKAIAGSDAYDDDFGRLIDQGSVESAFWELAIADVTAGCQILAPLYDSSKGQDGFVSLEVSPALAHDTANTTSAARGFHERINLPNLMVKIPATEAGIPAIRTMISEGRNINVTLIFSIERYGDVIEAYISGLESYAQTAGADLSKVQSVASFFISRVDTEVDRRIDKLADDGHQDVAALKGKAAVAQAKMAYQLFQERFSGERWERLAARGANVQRPLWASTSTKNPAYPDLLYVDSLIGPHTVNTMPDATVAAFLDHGTVARTVDAGVEEAKGDLDRLREAGVDMADVARVLEEEGVAAFAKSFEELIQSLTDKANALRGSR